MANYLSAGVYGTEIDLSASVPSVATGVTAYAGEFTKGQAYTRKLITTIEQLVDAFGTPTSTNFNDWFQCYNFLRNGSELYVVRAVNNDDVTELTYQDFVLNQTYYKGEIVSYEGSNFQALTTITATVAPTNGSDWAEEGETGSTFTDYVGQKETTNSGLYVTAANEKEFFSSYVPNTNEFETYYDSNIINVNTGMKFLSKSVGTVGNDIKICLSDNLRVGLDKNVENTWNGLESDGETIASDWVSVNSYSTDDVVFYFNEIEGFYQIFKSKVDLNSGTPSISADWENITHQAGDVIFYSITYTDIVTNEEKTVSSNFTSSVANNAEAPMVFENNKVVYSSKWAKHSTFDDIFENELGTDEVAVVIFDGNDLKESYIVSTKEDGKDLDGNNIFIDNVLLTNSKLVYSMTSGSPATLIQKDSLKGGTEGTVGTGDLMDAYNLFSNPEDFDVSIIIANEKINSHCLAISSTRKDCITICGVPRSLIVGNPDAIENVIKYSVTTLNIESSYGALYDNYIQVYDTYNSKYRWVNPAGAVAGSQVRTNNNADAWWANAGLDRGQIFNVTKIAYNPTLAERNALQKAKVNPIVSFPGQGNCIIWGQKTLLSRASAFDRLNVRQLFLIIEKAVNKAMKYFVFEPNDEFTRAQISAMINPFLENIKGRRGIYDYRVVCDETNNTPEIIDQNILKVAVLIKPTRTAEYIEVQYVATRTDADLSSIAKSLP